MTTNLKQRVDVLPTQNVMMSAREALSIITDLLALNKQMAEALDSIAGTSQAVVANPITVMRRAASEALQSYHQHGFGE